MEHLLSNGQTRAKNEVIKRSKRLLVPYFFYSYIIIIPRLMFNFYYINKIKLSTVGEILHGESSSTSLWYLWNLFMINIFFLVISRITAKKQIWLLIGAGLYIRYLLYPDFYFDKLLKYPLFYVMGIYLAAYFLIIKSWIKNKGLLMIFFMLADAVIVAKIFKFFDLVKTY